MFKIESAEITCLTPEQLDKLEGQQMSLDLDLSSTNDDITINLHDFDSMITNGGTGASPVLTIGDYSTNWNNSGAWSLNDKAFVGPASGKIHLTGDDADIEINGESIVGMLRDIRDRLNILQVSEEMEKEWDDLRALREQYEAKLVECREKSLAWQHLKSMPPPKID